MKMFQIRRYEMLIRVNAFGSARPDAFPATSVGGRLFDALTRIVGALATHVVAQANSTTAARQGASAKDAAHDHLRKMLFSLARTARVVTAGTPDLAGSFRMPKTHCEQRLLARARMMVQDATPFADAITAHHLPSTFLDDVAAAIAGVEMSIWARAAAKASRAAAGAGITHQLEAGRAIVQQLDAVVTNQFGTDEAALAEWKTARVLFNIPIRTRSTDTTPAPVPVP